MEISLCKECDHDPKWHILRAQTLMKLAALYERQRQPGLAGRQYRLAEKTLNDLEEKMPENAETLNRLAWFLVSCPDPERRNYARAAECAAKALKSEVRPDDALPDAKRTLGLAALRQGDPSKAAALFDESLSLRDRRDPVTLILLALAHCRNCERQQSAGAAKEALRSGWLALETYNAACAESKKRANGGDDEDYRQFLAEFLAGAPELSRAAR